MLLQTIQNGLEAAHVPYSYGFSIILLTALIKLVTYPLTKQQARGCDDVIGGHLKAQVLLSRLTQEGTRGNGSVLLSDPHISPFNVPQVESALAVQSLKPRIDLIKQRYGEDKDRISSETSVLYEQAGVNPLAGGAC